MKYNLRIVGAADSRVHHSTEHRQRLQADMALLLVSLIWGSAFVAQRVAAGQLGTFLFNGMRFLLAVLVLAPFAWFGRRKQPFNSHLDRRNLIGVISAGLLLLGGAAFQQAGLQYTTAGNAGFITGLYVVFIPLILAIVWHKPPPPLIWLAAGLAALGLFLLTTAGQLRLNPGDVLELIGALLWAMHVILIGLLVRWVNFWQVSIGQYLVCGVLSLLVGIAIEFETLPALAPGWWAVVYTGVLSVGVGYTLQVAAQRYAPPADAAIILSSEAVFAAGFGWLILDERLTALQLVGCGIMLAGMLVAQARLIRNSRVSRE